jgi:protein TonB
LNASILAALIAIPLLHPSMLPRSVNSWLIETPPPMEDSRPVVQPQHPSASTSEIYENRVLMPRQIPTGAWIPREGEDIGPGNVASLDLSGTGMGSPDNPFGGHRAQPDVRQAVQPIRRISLGVMEGLLVNRVLPVYPSTARAIRLSGTVQLQATISREGTIENLRVVSGPALLQAAALEAVKQWRYRPYLLNGEPVEVETTINVDFKLD